jgi:polyphenol oxidase
VVASLPKPSEGFEWTQAPWGPVLTCRDLLPVARHLFTTRELDLAPEFCPGPGWIRAAESVGVPPDRLFRPFQVHGTGVLEVLERSPVAWDRRQPPPADIIVTDDPERAVAVQVADCVPLLVADVRTGAVAAGHSGWRGTAAGVAAALVGAMQSRLGSRPADLVAAVGPSIGPCCLEVGEPVLDAFARQGHPATAMEGWFRRGAVLRLDLWRANRDQLRDAGLRPERVHVSGLCTVCHASLFHSYRRDGAGTGRMAAVIRPSRPPAPAG